MRRKILLAGVLAFYMFSAKAQKKDTSFRREKLNKTEIELMYSHYLQDGDNSAVTGGIGTEKLTVYSPTIRIRKTWENLRSFTFRGGSDIISSASTDKIDFVRSSASRQDARTYVNTGFSSPLPKKNMTWSLGTGFSIESDYFSWPLNMGIQFSNKPKMRTLSVELQMFFDDLRWGRINPGFYRPVMLIYPEELRGRDWYETTRRQSYNLKIGFTQVINKRNILGVYPELSLQQGLLATPFHRVYFAGEAMPKVENLPGQRLKAALGLRVNSFIGGRSVLKNSLDAYADDFGILGLALENETAVKINRILTLSPFARIYFQEGSRYFAPYNQHRIEELFYTSDYDLSGFMTYKLGMGLRLAPFKEMGKNNVFNEWVLRYAFLYRTNGLQAHMVSCMLNMTHRTGKKNKK